MVGEELLSRQGGQSNQSRPGAGATFSAEGRTSRGPEMGLGVSQKKAGLARQTLEGGKGRIEQGIEARLYKPQEKGASPSGSSI